MSADVICVRYQGPDLETIEAAREIMGQSVSQFTRSASVALARAVIEAAADAGISPGETSWDACRIEGRIERKP